MSGDKSSISNLLPKENVVSYTKASTEFVLSGCFARAWFLGRQAGSALKITIILSSWGQSLHRPPRKTKSIADKKLIRIAQVAVRPDAKKDSRRAVGC